MKVRRDDHPGVYTLAEIKTQIVLGAMTNSDLRQIISDYERSAFYLPEEVLSFLEKHLGTTIQHKNKFYIRESDESTP